MRDAVFLFVYGVLRDENSHPIAKRLRKESCFVGPGYMKGKLFLIDWYPGAIDSSDDQDRVYGDVFKLNAGSTILADIDKFEECDPATPEPHEYRREIRKIHLDGQDVSAFVYIYNRDIIGRKLIPDGDFMGAKTMRNTV